MNKIYTRAGLLFLSDISFKGEITMGSFVLTGEKPRAAGERSWLSVIFVVLLCLVMFRAEAGYGNSIEGQPQPCGEENTLSGGGAEVWARIGDRVITQEEVDTPLQGQDLQINQQLYQLRKRYLDALIRYKLLEVEAAMTNISIEALVEKEIKEKVDPVTDEEVTKYTQAFKGGQGAAQPNDETMRNFIYSQKYSAAFSEYAEQLKRKTSVEILLKEPQPLVQKVATADDPWTGAEDATVTIVEFVDFQCPACAQFQGVLMDMLKEFPGKIKLIVRDYPLMMHQHSEQAALAAACANEQGKFWEYKEVLFQNQDSLDMSNLVQFAGALGLDGAQFSQCLETGKYRGEINADKADAAAAGVAGTPTLFINGVKMSNLRPEAIRAAIAQELKPPTTQVARKE